MPTLIQKLRTIRETLGLASDTLFARPMNVQVSMADESNAILFRIEWYSMNNDFKFEVTIVSK